MARPIRVEVRWKRTVKLWYIVRIGAWETSTRTKRAAVIGAARFCRSQWRDYGLPCILLIYTKSNRITKGRNGEHSYGCDSRRRKG